MNVKHVTPVLLVEEIEPVLPFWERLGFERTAEVPEGERLGFVILVRDGAQIMYQSQESVRNDVAPLASAPVNGSFLFITVDDLDAFEKKIETAPIVPRRKTFYGSEELIVRDPAGNVVTFAQFAEEA